MRRSQLVVIAAMLPAATISAQQPASAVTQQRPNPMTQTFRSFAAQYGTWLVSAFASIPTDKYSYKPTPSQFSVGYIAQHLESANYQLCAHFSGMPRTVTARDSLADTLKAKWPKDTLVARLKASLEFCDGALARVNDATLADELPRLGQSAGQTAPRIRFLILHVTDLADHWSQIANYMRLNGMIPPSAQPRSGR